MAKTRKSNIEPLQSLLFTANKCWKHDPSKYSLEKPHPPWRYLEIREIRSTIHHSTPGWSLAMTHESSTSQPWPSNRQRPSVGGSRNSRQGQWADTPNAHHAPWPTAKATGTAGTQWDSVHALRAPQRQLPEVRQMPGRSWWWPGDPNLAAGNAGPIVSHRQKQ